MNPVVGIYRGSEKHKDRPAHGAKGTLCPEWTHSTTSGGLGHDLLKHDWLQTQAHILFKGSTAHPDGQERRYATINGIAFEAKPTNDGSWHGYPVPWESVPDVIVDQWLEQGLVSNREIKRHKKYRKDIYWALQTDTK